MRIPDSGAQPVLRTARTSTCQRAWQAGRETRLPARLRGGMERGTPIPRESLQQEWSASQRSGFPAKVPLQLHSERSS
jgi:hypothetical protein